MLYWRATEQAEQVAYRFLANGEKETESLSYRELYLRAQATAFQLKANGVQPGERAMLLYPSGLELIVALFGCLYAGVIAVLGYPPRRNQHLARIRAIIQDAQPGVVFTTSELLGPLQAESQKLDLEDVLCLTLDPNPGDKPNDWEPISVTTDTLAFLQYTSGSTSSPKGVKISHGNLYHNLHQIQESFNHTPKSQGVIWLPPHHDMGLIGGILQPLFAGFPVALMPPAAFLQKPIRWLRAIATCQGTTNGGPNFAYDLCVQKIKPEQLQDLDLSCWQVAFIGAEPIQAKTLEQFSAKFEVCGFRREAFYPCYGMAETTLMITGSHPTQPPTVKWVKTQAMANDRVIYCAAEEEDAQALVGCGHIVDGMEMVIVNRQSTKACVSGEIGEIWVRGASVTQGYWHQSIAEQDCWGTWPEESSPLYLRTGDLGFVDDMNELFITGRLRDMLIIRGKNHYPQDIEKTVQQCHAALRPNRGAAFGVDQNGQNRLIIIQEVERVYWRTLDVETVTAQVKEQVTAQHQLRVDDVVLVRPGSIPLTTSGKIQRYICRLEYLDGKLQVIPSG
ncbi:MAG: fatty acyl-AMP ligase [Cyanobacteria bacterium P01_C01_bin.118]